MSISLALGDQGQSRLGRHQHFVRVAATDLGAGYLAQSHSVGLGGHNTNRSPIIAGTVIDLG